MKYLVRLFLSVIFMSTLINAKEKVHLHGYAEVHSNNTINGTRKLDAHRSVIGIKAMLSEKISFDMEVDFEHAFDEPELEFAKVDFNINEMLTIRTGHILMPIGPLNEFHEPPLFYSVERPYVQKNVIPTTWGETGAGLALALIDNNLTFRTYVVNGLKPDDIITKEGKAGIRKGRYKGVSPSTKDIASASRLEYSVMPGLDLGGSAYFGGADQSDSSNAQISVGLFEGDLKFKKMGIEIQGLFAQGMMSGTFFENNVVDSDSNMVNGTSFSGFMAEGAYHLQDLVGEGSDIIPFVRFESYDQDAGDAGTKTGNNIIIVGVAYLPVPKVSVKVDMELWSYEDDTKDSKQMVNLGVGVMY